MTTSKKLPYAAIIAVSLLLCGLYGGAAGAAVVINELHTNPDVKTELVEFVELTNTGTADVDLGGWSFTEGVFYSFPAGASLPAGGYIIVAQSPDAIQAKWGSVRERLPENLIFGPWGGALDGEGERVTLRDAGGDIVDQVDYGLGFPWPTVGDPLAENAPGSGTSLQLVNPAFDNDLGGSWRSALPTPLGVNAVFAEVLPPHVRQVKHSPRQPAGGQVVTVTAKVTDADGVASVMLKYQPVSPGAYIARTDPQFRAGWVSVPMVDDGLDGDVRAGDDIYTARIPADVQMHRRLVRYQIVVSDTLNYAVQVPYADDPQPNFAYFVYDGVPGWRGAVRPGTTEVVEFPAEVMRSLPVYHLIAKKQDVADAFYLPGAQKGRYGGSDFPWLGTLVYDGQVYDHITFRARGGVWRFAMGKNMPKFDFKRGHYFRARDDYGREYGTRWDKMNFSACIQQGDYQHRGEQGMFEAASFKLFNLMGCAASKTHWLHFRVIDDFQEAGASQYEGDFWGLYMVLEQMDGRFLDEHGLPDGNLFKMDSGSGDAGPGGGALNNQGPTQPSDNSDLVAFSNDYRVRPQEPWWRQNVDLTGYYGFRCVVEGVHHGDMEGGKNWFFYHNPETGRWSILPWDLDLSWAENMYGTGQDTFQRQGGVLNIAGIQVEYQNRMREFLDLLYNADQLHQMLDDLADIIDPPTGGPTMVDADRAMWDYNPILVSSYINPSKAGQGRFYQRAATKDFRGMVQLMKDYVVFCTNNNRNWMGMSGQSMSLIAADAQIPSRPTVVSTGPAGFPINALTFRSSAFSDPQGAGTFEAMKWRIAEVAPGSRIAAPVDAGTVLVPDGSTWKYFKGLSEPSAVTGAWRRLEFDDGSWPAGDTAIGFGESFIVTNLADMRGRYSTVYLRRTFDVQDLDAIDKLILEVKYDDGVLVWINGTLAYQDNVAGENLPCTAVADSAIENATFIRRDLGDPRTRLTEGTNIVAVQVLNASVSGSSDCFIDLRLIGEKSKNGNGSGEPNTPQVYRREPGKYEIEAAWESDEIRTFDSNIRIPATAVRPGRTYRVRCRMKDNTGRWSNWSNPVQFVAGESVAAEILADLRVTEVMYNPAGPAAGSTANNDDFEFIELKNIGDETLDLKGVSFADGITFAFDGSSVTSLAPGKFVLVVRNKQAFLSRYGQALAGLIAGEYMGRLANDGENVALVDLWNGTIAEFEYGDGRGWPVAADGTGHSLVPLDTALFDEPQGSLNYAGNWRASTYIGGSPGADDPAPGATILLNELQANGSRTGDWVELYNPTNATVALAGWYLSDDLNEPGKWPVPAESIPPQGYLDLDQFNDFGLSRDGEELLLSHLPGAGRDRVVDAVRFKAQESDLSLGRYPDGAAYWFRLEMSPGQANANPILDVLIDELMYHPADPNEEYVELYNPTGQPVALDGWRLDGAVDYNFPAGVAIPAGGRLLVVPFDPAVETSRFSAFVDAYGTGPLAVGVELLGPWTGSLSNRGERLALEKSQPAADAADPVAWVVVDEVIYSDVAPWPAGTDGHGSALERTAADADHSGNDPANWQAATPSPGR